MWLCGRFPAGIASGVSAGIFPGISPKLPPEISRIIFYSSEIPPLLFLGIPPIENHSKIRCGKFLVGFLEKFLLGFLQMFLQEFHQELPYLQAFLWWHLQKIFSENFCWNSPRNFRTNSEFSVEISPKIPPRITPCNFFMYFPTVSFTNSS